MNALEKAIREAGGHFDSWSEFQEAVEADEEEKEYPAL